MFEESCSRRQLLRYFAGGALLFLGLKGRSASAANNVDISNVLATAASHTPSRIILCRHEQVLDPAGCRAKKSCV